MAFSMVNIFQSVALTSFVIISLYNGDDLTALFICWFFILAVFYLYTTNPEKLIYKQHYWFIYTIINITLFTALIYCEHILTAFFHFIACSIINDIQKWFNNEDTISY